MIQAPITAIHITQHFLSVHILHHVIAVHIHGGMVAVDTAIDVQLVLKLVLFVTHLLKVLYILQSYILQLTMSICVANNCVDGAVRLVNGTSSNEGRAEYCYEGDWVPFCGMSLATASLVCNQLGYNYTCKEYYTCLASVL